MALFKRFFYRKPPDHLLEISEKVFVFDCCFSSDVLEADTYKTYMSGVITELQDYYPDTSFMVFNMKEGGNNTTQISDIFSNYDMTVTEYPWQYEGCPLLPLVTINKFLETFESWMISSEPKSVLLMHCERGGWPVLAFMLAALLLLRRQYTGEQKTLETVYKQAPRELLHLLSPLNPQPSQLRYLQYIAKRNLGVDWPPEEAPLALDCVILRVLPLIGGKGCRPIIRIYGHDPFSIASSKSCKLLFSTSNTKSHARYYGMNECHLAKIDIHYRVQGDVVLECIHLDDDHVKEEILFRVVFHTAFVRGYVLMLGRDEVDLIWDARDQVPKDFKAEVLFVDADPLPSIINTERVSIDGSESTGSGSGDEFFEVEEIFSNAVDHDDFKVEDTSFFEDDISGFEVEPPSSQDHPSYGRNQIHHHEADPSLQLVEDVDLKPTIVKDVDTKASIFKDVDLKSTVVLTSDSYEVDRSDVNLDGLVEEVEVKKDTEENQRVKEVQTTSIVSQKSLGNLKKESPKHVRQVKSDVIPWWVPSNKGFYARRKSAPPVLPPSTESKLGEKKVFEGKRRSRKQASCPPSLDVQRVKKPYDGSLDLPKSVKNMQIKPVIAPSPLLPSPGSPQQAPSLDAQVKKPCDGSLELPKSEKSMEVKSAEVPSPPVCEATATPLPPPVQDAQPSPSPSPPLPVNEAPAPLNVSTPTKPGASAPPPTPPINTIAAVAPLPPQPPPITEAIAPPPPPPPPPPPSGAHVSGPPPPPLPPPGTPAPLPPAAPAPPPPPGVPAPPPAPPPPPGAPAPPPPPAAPAPAPPPPPGAPAPPPPPGAPALPRPPGVPGPPPPPGGAPGPPPPPGAPGPPGGPPPPPGRLGGGPGRGRGRGGLQVKKSNLKPLHWNKVSRALAGSLWAELQNNGTQRYVPDFDMSEIETLFSAIAPKKVAPKDAEKKKASSSKPEVVHLIDLRRANNTEIMLTKVKMPLPEITEAILAMDEERLDVDQVENILKFCPTKEEMEQLKNYTGDKELLGKCEQYFLELMTVPRMEAKLNVFLFKIQFNTQLAEFKKNLDIVNSACDEVRKSNKLKEIMKRILYLGNTLNQGTARGAAVGFKLDSLLKLTDTRSTTSRMTLMHYLCKVLATKAPALLDFHEDLVSLEAATKVQLKALAEEMQAIILGLKKVKQELDASANDGPISEGFHKELKEFIGNAEAEVNSVTNFYAVVGRNADALALYFGEDPARCPFEQATLTLLNFVRLFRKSDEENRKNAEAEKKKEEAEKAKKAGEK
uniref:formin-like protein 20 n=1 Tax=Erigeron canadensis TaxID=72917 RepID=UPI001CB9B050|nr:formin-like protein 20 [Erigeron canadensis]